MATASHPSYLASEIAEVIKNDPVAAKQIKEYFRGNELIELLDVLPPLETEYPEDDEPKALQAIQYCVDVVPLHQILKAYNKR
jgi:hypothetical protein